MEYKWNKWGTFSEATINGARGETSFETRELNSVRPFIIKIQPRHDVGAMILRHIWQEAACLKSNLLSEEWVLAESWCKRDGIWEMGDGRWKWEMEVGDGESEEGLVS